MSTPNVCLKCGSSNENTVTVTFDKNGNQRLKVECSSCGSFIKWDALPITLERAQRYTVEFGRHIGKSLSQIEVEAPSYIEWLSLEHSSDTVKELAKTIIAQRIKALDQTHKDV